MSIYETAGLIIRKQKMAFLIAATTSFLSSAAFTHHGEAPHYDASQEIVMEAVLTDFHLVNPHAYVYFDVRGDGAEAEHWRCELGTNLRRFGWTEETLAPGGRVRVTGNPARREEQVCKILSIEHEDGRTIGFRGAPTEGTSTYKPQEALDFTPEEKPELNILATGTDEALNRKIVDVPTEGIFGYWKATGDGAIGIAGINRRGNRNSELIESDLPQATEFSVPKYTSVGKELVDSYDERFDNPSLRCSSSIFDGMIHHGNNNEFVQESENTLRWVNGYMDLVRTINLTDDEHTSNVDPSNMGYSIGRWEGRSLIVETRGLKKQWLYNTSSVSHVIGSDQLYVVEKITHDKANDQLVIEYQVEDPVYWENSLQGVIRLSRSDTAYQNYGCVELAGENNSRPDGSTVFD